MKATINKPEWRTINRDAPAGSDDDWTKFNPWRAPGAAPVYDPCGRASGGPHMTGGHGEFTNTSYAKVGDLGSQLPKLPSGAVWKAGSVVEASWSLRANHGGYVRCHRPAATAKRIFVTLCQQFLTLATRPSCCPLLDGTGVTSTAFAR